MSCKHKPIGGDSEKVNNKYYFTKMTSFKITFYILNFSVVFKSTFLLNETKVFLIKNDFSGSINCNTFTAASSIIKKYLKLTISRLDLLSIVSFMSYACFS
jgi:hypothetical protein